MTLNQFAVAVGADRKWLLNSSAILRRPIRLTPESARWWGMVRMLEQAFGLTLASARAAANRAFGRENDVRHVVVAEDSSSAVSIRMDLFRYDTTFLANLSRARVRETPRRRGRPVSRSGDPIRRATAYGLDIGLIQASLARSPGERVSLLDRNRAFTYEMQASRKVR